MSQSGLLTENELPGEIYRHFDLKLDKDAFVRPKRDVVIDIYTRFLDKLGFDWKKPPLPGVEPSLLILMTAHIRRCVSRYGEIEEFNINDLINPNRRRLVQFLNAIVLFKIEFDEAVEFGHECELKRAQKDERVELRKRELSNKRVLLEELAFKKAQLPDTTEREERIATLHRELEAKKKIAARLPAEKDTIKREINDLNRKKQIGLAAMQETTQRVNKDLQRKELKSKFAEHAKTLKILSRELDELRACNRSKLSEKEREQQKLDEQIRMKQKANIDIISKAKAIAEKTDREIEELETQKEAYREQVEKYVSQLAQEETAVVDEYTESRKIVGKFKTMMTSYDLKLKELVSESPKDRTFIKPRP